MHLVELRAEDVRCHPRVELSLHEGLNLLCGPNGSGKTTVLEAAFLLGRGRSFRTRSSERLIRHGADRAVAFGRIAGAVPHQVGVEVARDPSDGARATRARIDGEATRTLAELSAAFPVDIIEPSIQGLVEGGASGRRRWLDWGVFHVEHAFADLWLRYARALRQRNAALRTGAGRPVVMAWDGELSEAGGRLADLRARHFATLQPRLEAVQRALLGDPVAATLSSGWERETSLAEALAGAWEQDEHRRTTTVGPHRADVRLRVGVRSARDVLSRGQQKLLALALVLAQLELLRDQLGLRPTLLVDDPAAELDASRLGVVVERVQALGAQLVVTTLAADSTPFGRPDRVFHVEQGRVRPV
jgi:DNA replication and repair protein RecF